MDFLGIHYRLGLALAAVAAVLAGTGWRPGSAVSREIPVSVRENPGSSHPIYARFRVPSAARTTTTTTRGGGWSSGK